jgi:hypothetical protein
MKKLFVIAIAAFMGLTMNAQPNTKQQVGVAQSKMMRPVETKLDLSAVKQMPKQPGKLVRMSKDYGKKLSLRNIDLKPVAHSKTNVNDSTRQHIGILEMIVIRGFILKTNQLQ